MLRAVLFRFSVFGFGDRTCFLQLWTSLQQLICAQSITGLEVGAGGEEETEVACLAVRGLTAMLISAAAASTSSKLPGCPLTSRLSRHSRSTLPRLTAQIPSAALNLPGGVSDRRSCLFLGGDWAQRRGGEWLVENVEEIGSSVNLISQINSPQYFRQRIGISPLVSLKIDTAETKEETNSTIWRPDLESSVQFLFDLFLRWIHFTQDQWFKTYLSQTFYSVLSNHKFSVNQTKHLTIG